MRKIQRDFTVIAPKAISTKASKRDEEYADLWEQYRPKIEKMARLECTPGLVGLDYEDVVQAGQDILLHALRTCRKEKRFSTYFYTLFKRQIYYMRGCIFYKRKTILCGKGEKQTVSVEIYPLEAHNRAEESEAGEHPQAYSVAEKGKHFDRKSIKDITQWINESVVDERLKTIVLMVLEGRTNTEICSRMKISTARLSACYRELQPILEQQVLPYLQDTHA